MQNCDLSITYYLSSRLTENTQLLSARLIPLVTFREIKLLFSGNREGRGMWCVWETGEMNTGFWWGDLMERDHLEDLGICGMIILKLTFKIVGWGGMDWIALA